ncbi:MAG: KpsF/GutQ family sugar-phosphate isomerase [Chitinophagaceae bacterium]
MNTNQILSCGQRTIRIEKEGLELLHDSLNEQFVLAVQSIAKCKGRVVVSGIGKSAYIAKKIVATLNSTGTLALYMHAAEALHGDLGMITQEDVIMVLSKGGEGTEIKVWIPLLKHRNIKIIGITSKEHSFLARHSDACIITPTYREDELLNIVPTTSTTQQMAIGDAIAVCLMYMKNFNQENFASFHPGGSLGRQLLLRAKDLYPKHGKPQIQKNTSLKDIIYAISKYRVGAIAVISDEGQVIGIIADGDLRRMMQQENHNWENLTAEDIMTKKPKTIEEDCLAVEALQIMEKYKITQLPVVGKENRFLGMIHLHDLIEVGLMNDKL